MSAATGRGLSAELAEVALAPVADRDEAMEMARWFLLDTVSVAAAGAGLEAATVERASAALASVAGEGAATSWPLGRRLAAPAAAATNALAVHTIDFDDSYMRGGVKAHFSASIIPTALAVGETVGAGGAAVLEAVVRGFEVAARLGHASTPAVVERWHPTGVLGVVGCAAAAGWLMGLDHPEMEVALGLAADHGAGTRFCLASGDATKSLHAGFAAHDGIVAAVMAQAGVPGPVGFFEGLKGWFETYPGHGAPDGAPGHDVSLIRTNCTKFFPVMHALHAAVTVAIEHAAAHPVAGPEDIAEVEVVQAVQHAGFGAYWEPETPLAARLSLPYSVAASLVDGECGLDQFREDRLGDPAWSALLGRVRIVASEEMEASYGSRVASEVTVRYGDGSSLTGFAADPLGFPERPATEAQRWAKFHGLLSGWRPEHVAALEHEVRALADAPSVEGLGRAILAGWSNS